MMLVLGVPMVSHSMDQRHQEPAEELSEEAQAMLTGPQQDFFGFFCSEFLRGVHQDLKSLIWVCLKIGYIPNEIAIEWG